MAWPKGVPHRSDMIARRVAKVRGVKRGPTPQATRDKIAEGHRRRLLGLPSAAPRVKRPYAKYRRIVEDYLGVVLPSWILVHHINLDDTDDRIENLAIVTRPVHNAIHTCIRAGLHIDVTRFSVTVIKEQHEGAAFDRLFA